MSKEIVTIKIEEMFVMRIPPGWRRGDALKRCEADGEQLEKLSAY